ncbi:MAG TPA: sugar MFS transporter [Bacteroidales bacterium]|nr:sugar MFS transporter [Bacteroidales bacterium]
MQASAHSKFKAYIFPMIIIGVLFFLFGFVTWLNGILIPFLRTACNLADYQAYFVTFAFYISYFVMALPMSKVLKKTGFHNGMTVGLWLMAAGALVFIPAAYSRSFILFLAGLFVQGTGLTILQTASNPYVTILGPAESAAKRISIMGICNKIAGTLAPIILATALIKDSASVDEKYLNSLDALQKAQVLDELARQVVFPYLIMAGFLFVLGLLLRLTPLPEIDMNKEDQSTEGLRVELRKVISYPNLLWGVIALFFYVGVEVIAGDTIIRYGQSLGISMDSAKYFTSLTLLGMILGYILGIILIPKYISQSKALAIAAILGIFFSIGAIYTPNAGSIQMPFRDLLTWEPVTLTIPFTVLFVAILGLANAIMWPAIWPLALNGLGRYTKTGSALLIMAIAGGALLPLLYGRLVDGFSAQTAYWILIPAYLLILWFATKGCKLIKKA